MARFPAVALSGLERYRGAAYPPEYRGNLFSAQHNARRVARHALVPEGATFRSEDADVIEERLVGPVAAVFQPS